jgi:DNA (cytosine-5)-methyltransferase 1
MKRKKKPLLVGDLLCGAGGTSTGAEKAVKELGYEMELVAINHWPLAIETHRKNHPTARHYIEDVNVVKPQEVCEEGYLDLLVASPECIYFSRARGGKPVNDQKRMNPWAIIRWLTDLDVRTLLVENVPEFCFPPETAILSKRGMVPISEICVGDEVWTHNARWKPVTHVAKHVSSTVRVVGYGNSIIEPTPNHEFYARQRAPKITVSGKYGRHKTQMLEPEWVCAGILSGHDDTSAYSRKHSGYMWATPYELPHYWMRLPEQLGSNVHGTAFFYMIGRWLGDGWVHKRKGKQDTVRICANKAESDDLQEKLNETQMVWHRSSHSKSVDIFDLSSAESRRLIPWLLGNFGQYAGKKTLPAWIYGANEQQRWALIEGYYASDGHEYFNGLLIASSISRCLAVGIRLLLQSLGVNASISLITMKDLPKVNCREETMRYQQSYSVSWRRNTYWEKNFKTEFHLWGKVRSVKPCRDNVEVIDITVADDHSFIADGQVVHNCNWGPLDDKGKPLSELKGLHFEAWIRTIWNLGYAAEWKFLNAADYGDATTRKRFFLIARKDGVPIRWPEPTHTGNGNPQFYNLPKWRAAREIIDWENHGRSLLDDPKYQKRPLSINTRKRIARGLEKYGGVFAPLYVNLLGLDGKNGGSGTPEAFTLANRSNSAPRSMDQPIHTVTAENMGNLYIVQPDAEPFVLGQQSASAPRDTDQPIPTVAAAGAISLIDPQLVIYHGKSNTSKIDDPVPSQPTKSKLALVNPQIVKYYGTKADTESVDDPLSTVTTKGRFGLVKPEAIIVQTDQSGRPGLIRSVDDPVHTIVTKQNAGLVDPVVLQVNHGDGNNDNRTRKVDEPLPTLTTKRNLGVAEPVLRNVNGDPIDPKRLVLVDGKPYLLDIRFRMLSNKELARAMGFDDEESEYEFVGNVAEVTKQIGNAVPVHLACELVKAVLQD